MRTYTLTVWDDGETIHLKTQIEPEYTPEEEKEPATASACLFIAAVTAALEYVETHRSTEASSSDRN